MKILKGVIGSRDTCPNCGINFNGEDIYEYFLNQYKDPEKALKTAEMYGWSEDNKKCFRKEIAIETEEWDGASFYQCPNCDSVWKRFRWSNEKYLGEE